MKKRVYLSDCCNVPADKPALLKPKDPDEAKDSGLGKWRCTRCKRHCKCRIVEEK